MPTRPNNNLVALLAALLAAALLCSDAHAQSASGWTISPYRVRVLVAVDVTNGDSQKLTDQILQRMAERADSAIGALWNLQVQPVTAAERPDLLRAAFEGLASPDALPESEGKLDKTFLIGVKQDARGVRVAVVEHDHNLLRSSLPLIEPTPTLARVPEGAFRQVCDTFAPIAEFRVSQEDRNRINLVFRGAELPRRAGAPDWVRQGDIFLPMLRKLNRDGQIDPQGVRDVPWTYLELTESGKKPFGTFISHTKRPLASRRRGRVDYLAIRLPRRKGATILRAHAREDESKPLVGYQVYLQDGPDAERTLAGATGPDGRITIEPGKSKVLMAFIKSGSQLVAKLPIMPGAVDEIDVPLLDETPRLQAEAKLGILREALIDLVAQRKILIARADTAIEAKSYDAASKLIDQLERLPARALFDRKLRQLEQVSMSDIPMVQKRIDRIFSDTRTVLASFLNPREIQEVKSRLANARRK